MTRGLVIGKFYPPHLGHMHLIRTALAGCDELTVVVCEHPSQSLSGELRAQWIREEEPRALLRVVPDVVPADDSEGWARYTREFLGYVPDIVFTSEAYGEAYARFLGCRHVCVDLAREVVPVAGTAIRTDPLGHWNFLVPGVKGHYARRVVVLGAESTGTTTLAEDLAAALETCWVPEYGRDYWARREPTEPATEEFVHIAREQQRLEDEAARSCNRVLVCDTDAFATCVWHERYVGHWSDEVAAVAGSGQGKLYLVTDVEIPFVQDGTRDGEHLREWMHGRFVEELQRTGRRWQQVQGQRSERMSQAQAAVRTWLSAE